MTVNLGALTPDLVISVTSFFQGVDCVFTTVCSSRISVSCEQDGRLVASAEVPRPNGDQIPK